MADVEITLDLHGDVVHVPRSVVSDLAAAAAAQAGVSSRHRDLSLALGRALEAEAVSLDLDEVRALRAVLEENGDVFGRPGIELLRVASAATA